MAKNVFWKNIFSVFWTNKVTAIWNDASPFVRFSICPGFFSGTTNRNFLIFLHEGRVLFDLQVTESDFFFEKSYLGFLDLKDSEWSYSIIG